MEIKINKEILTYQETIFFGLTMRQFSAPPWRLELPWGCICCSASLWAGNR